MKTRRALLALALALGSMIAAAPVANANECQENGLGNCKVQDATCRLGTSLEQRFGIGWACTH